MRHARSAPVGFAAALLVLGLVFFGPGRGFAQDAATPDAAGVETEATPGTDVAQGRPAHIHEGTCDDLDPNPLFPLSNVVTPEGDAAGPEEALQAEISVSTVAVDLATILAADHAINVHLSPEEADVYIACGEIGGVALDAAGSLAIGLRELNDSGFSGVAYLTPSAADPTQTDISLFLVEGLTEGDDDANAGEDEEDAGAEDATGEADDAGGVADDDATEEAEDDE